MSTIHLGNLGVERGPIDMNFGWFGATIRVHPQASDMEFTEWLEQVAGVEFDADDPEAMDPSSGKDAVLALMRFMRQQIHPEDFDKFWRLGKTNGQSTLDIMQVSMRIVEAVTGFPTGQPSDSSSGDGDTSTNSKVASSSAGSSPRTRAEESSLRMLSGRPDLQLVVVQARESREREQVA